MQITDFFRIHISCPRKESKDLPCKSLHFVHIRGKKDQKKVRKFANLTLCIYADTSVSACICRVRVSASVMEFHFQMVY